MRGQEGDAVSPRLQAALRLSVAQPFKTVQQQIGIELVYGGERGNLRIHYYSRIMSLPVEYSLFAAAANRVSAEAPGWCAPRLSACVTRA
jgi:hypothetical protein